MALQSLPVVWPMSTEGSKSAKRGGGFGGKSDTGSSRRGLMLVASAVLLLILWAGVFGLNINPLRLPSGDVPAMAFGGDGPLKFEASLPATLAVVAGACCFLACLLRQIRASETGGAGNALEYLGREASKLFVLASRPSKPGTLDVLDGARAVAMLLIVAFHCFSLPLSRALPGTGSPEGSAAFVRLWTTTGAHSIVKHGDLLGVECFLVASGVLTGVSLLRAGGVVSSAKAAAGGPARALEGLARAWAEFHSFLWLRWLRLVPPALAVVALSALLDPTASVSCSSPRAWFGIFFFLNNNIEYWSSCCFHTWYCALQMQLYVVGAPLLMLIRHLISCDSHAELVPQVFLSIDSSPGVPSSSGRGGLCRTLTGRRMAWLLLGFLFVAAVANRGLMDRFTFGLLGQTLSIRCPAFLVGVAVALALHLEPALGRPPAAGADDAGGLPLPAGASTAGRGRPSCAGLLDLVAIAMVVVGALLGNMDESGDFEFAKMISQSTDSMPPESRRAWALRALLPPALDAALGWLLLALLQGRLRTAAGLLRWRWWRPISATSYSTFLVQFLLVNRSFQGPWPTASWASSPFAPLASDSQAGLLLRSAALILVCLPMSLALGVLFYLLVEAPIRDFCKPASPRASAAGAEASMPGPGRVLCGTALTVLVLGLFGASGAV